MPAANTNLNSPDLHLDWGHVEEVVQTAINEHDTAVHESKVEAEQLLQTVTAQLRGDVREIPTYSAHSTPLSLVSFRCMMQDTGYPMEVYMPGPNGDAPTDAMNMGDLKERWVGWGVEVPGQTKWAAEAPTLSARDPSASSRLTNGVARLSVNGHTAWPHVAALQQKYPLPDDKEGYLGALIKVYDEDATFKPSAVHTFVGLVSNAALPDPTAAERHDDDETAATIVPAIHVLYTSPDDPFETATADDTLGDVREELKSYIASALPGADEVAAEYLLLSLVSRPSIRPVGLPPLGTLSLNLVADRSASSGALGPRVCDVLRHVVPALVNVDLTIPLLHSTPFTPSSPDSASLQSGLLQLAQGTVLLVDETHMGEGGKLEEKAVKNLQALSTCLSEQKVPYDYPYMPNLKMDCSIRGVVVSEGRSLVPTDVHVVLRGAEEAIGAGSSPSEDKLRRMRSYLLYHGSAAHAAQLRIPDDVADTIQDEFVEMRANASGSGTAGQVRQQAVEDAESVLKRRMRIARLMAISYPEATLTADRWRRVVDMDIEAQRRLAERGSRGGERD